MKGDEEKVTRGDKLVLARHTGLPPRRSSPPRTLFLGAVTSRWPRGAKSRQLRL